MQKRWTLHVENFGRIKTADIKVAPMMLFVGQNNTGKSYMASLLWGIETRSLFDFFFSKNLLKSKSYKNLKKLILSGIERKKSKLDKEFIQAVICFYNEYLKQQKNRLIRDIFTTADLKIGELSLTIKDEDISDLSIEWEESDDAGVKSHSSDLGYHFVYNKDHIDFSIAVMVQTLLFQPLVSPIYLPASRTGFMLSFQSLYQASLLERWGKLSSQQAKGKLSLPTINFLHRLLSVHIISDKQNPYVKIAYLLEKEILEGRIGQTPKPAVGFYYHPESMKESLPFHLTSSLITELAPLIIFLKGIPYFDTLIFEEPESHLHLNVQRILAKYLVKLLNHGMSIWMTTHSDIFFQQINNLIASTPERKSKLRELSYQDDEMIDPKNIEAYDFRISKDGMTEVVPLEKTEDGFIVKSFNQAIMEQSLETIKLETESKDAE